MTQGIKDTKPTPTWSEERKQQFIKDTNLRCKHCGKPAGHIICSGGYYKLAIEDRGLCVKPPKQCPYNGPRKEKTLRIEKARSISNPKCALCGRPAIHFSEFKMAWYCQVSYKTIAKCPAQREKTKDGVYKFRENNPERVKEIKENHRKAMSSDEHRETMRNVAKEKQYNPFENHIKNRGSIESVILHKIETHFSNNPVKRDIVYDKISYALKSNYFKRIGVNINDLKERLDIYKNINIDEIIEEIKNEIILDKR